MTKQLYNGWTIDFQKNVHMYCHRLTASKGGNTHSIPCENSPLGNGLVVMWIYALELEKASREDLLRGLLDWADASGLKCRIYTARDAYENHEPDPPNSTRRQAAFKMTALRIAVGLTLAFVVSTINGIASIAYLVGGEFEVSMQAVSEDRTRDDPRWQSQKTGRELTTSPQGGLATLSLLSESKFGRFGLLLQAVCLLQFVSGLLVVFRSTAGTKKLIFLILVAIAGVSVEVAGAQYSSTWGITNTLGFVVSALLIPVALMMHKKYAERQETPKAT